MSKAKEILNKIGKNEDWESEKLTSKEIDAGKYFLQIIGDIESSIMDLNAFMNEKGKFLDKDDFKFIKAYQASLKKAGDKIDKKIDFKGLEDLVHSFK